MTKEEADREADRLLKLLDVGLKAMKHGDDDFVMMVLKETLASAERLPKKDDVT